MLRCVPGAHTRSINAVGGNVAKGITRLRHQSAFFLLGRSDFAFLRSISDSGDMYQVYGATYKDQKPYQK